MKTVERALWAAAADWRSDCRNDKVLDPARGFDRAADVAIQGGRIVAVKSGIAASAAEVIGLQQ